MSSPQDAWGLFKSRAETYPVLGADEQAALWQSYDLGRQAHLALTQKGGRRVSLRRAAEAGDAAYLALCGSNWRLVQHTVTEVLRERGMHVDAERWADLCSEGNLAMCEAIERFDPARGWSLSSHIAVAVDRRVNDALAGELPASWSKVNRIVSSVEQSLTTKLERTPSSTELEVAAREHCVNWAKDRLAEAGEQVSEEKALAKLVRQGTWAALDRLGEVQAASRGLSLDREDNQGLSLHDMMAGSAPGEAVDVIAWFLSSLPEMERELISRRFALDGGVEARYEDLVGEYGQTWPEVRGQVNHCLGRMSAPHAHYASCAGEVLEQCFEFEDDEPRSVAGRLANRVGRAVLA